MELELENSSYGYENNLSEWWSEGSNLLETS
jgi:hypothetical protein